MKQIRFICGIVVLILVLVTGLTYADEICIDVSFPDPVITSRGEYHGIEMQDMRSIANPGEPVLPVKGVKVLIPFGQRIRDYRVELDERVELPGYYLIEPGQKEMPLSFEGVAEETLPNKGIYERDDIYPDIRVAKLPTKQVILGYDIAVINLHPVEYCPLSGRLAYYRSMTLIVTTEPVLVARTLSATGEVISPTEIKQRLRAMDDDKQRLLEYVDNPQTISTYNKEENIIELNAATIQTESTLTTLAAPGNYQYVLITKEEFSDAFQPLIDYKIEKGITATMVTTEWIYAHYDGTRPDGGVDNQTKIRNFIIDAYHNWHTKYVLLGGDGDGADVGGESGDNIIPARVLYYHASDLYYACLDGSFDYDGDGRYGSYNDGVAGGEIDLLAEVYVGRAPVDSVTEVENFVNKTIAYDNSNSSYLQNVYMAGELLWASDPPTYGADYMEEIRLGSDNHGYTTTGFVDNSFFDVKTLYDKDYSWPKEDLINILNNHVHIINHLGHANVTHIMKMSNSDVDTMLNNEEYFFGYSQGCYAGAFNNRAPYAQEYFLPNDCILEHLTTGRYGAFAFIGNSRYGYGVLNSTNGSSQYYNRQFWDAVLGEGILNLGRANQDSKEDNIPYLNYNQNRLCYLELNLFGDPELALHAEYSGSTVIISSLYPNQGYIQTNVTITGQGFGATQGASKVTFNGVEATDYLSWTGNQIEVKVPAGTTIGPVVAATVTGTSNTDKVFTVWQAVGQYLISDINRDGQVNIADFGILVSQYLKIGAMIDPERIRADINGNGQVNIVDFGLLMKDYLKQGTLITDINKDGQVNIADHDILSEFLGQSVSAKPRADVNRDGNIGFDDLEIVKVDFTKTIADITRYLLDTDLNRDGSVDTNDLRVVIDGLLPWADVNGDGVINAWDVNLVERDME
ncbi:MAG: C25 family cysteine peptidase [Candidatus Omnitrophota bacterium]